jgi:serine/threonine protein kinase
LLLGGPDENRDSFGKNRRFQHYELSVLSDGTTLWELGRGAMGITYHAVDTNLGSAVALKLISARFSGDARARERFRREARAAAQLHHPNVATVFHYGETPSGQCFYAMELVEGETLEVRIRRDGALPVSAYSTSRSKLRVRWPLLKNTDWSIAISNRATSWLLQTM